MRRSSGVAERVASELPPTSKSAESSGRVATVSALARPRRLRGLVVIAAVVVSDGSTGRGLEAGGDLVAS
jgi:hypothetical protein